MIKLYIDQLNSNNVIELKHDLYSNEQLVEELTYALDMIISDCTVKVGEKYKKTFLRVIVNCANKTYSLYITYKENSF